MEHWEASSSKPQHLAPISRTARRTSSRGSPSEAQRGVENTGMAQGWKTGRSGGTLGQAQPYDKFSIRYTCISLLVWRERRMKSLRRECTCVKLVTRKVKVTLHELSLSLSPTLSHSLSLSFSLPPSLTPPFLSLSLPSPPALV